MLENSIKIASPYSFELLFIRHGQTDANGKSYQGELPSELNETGKKQMAEAAEEILPYIKDKKISTFYSSQMKRAVQSLEIINSKLKLVSAQIPELREFKIGILQGKTSDAYQAMLKEAKIDGENGTVEEKHAFKIISGEVDGQYIEGESVNMVYERALKAIKKIADHALSQKDEAVLAIGHEWFLRSIIAKKLKIDKDRIKIINGGIISCGITVEPKEGKNMVLSITLNPEQCTKCTIDQIDLNKWLNK